MSMASLNSCIFRYVFKLHTFFLSSYGSLFVLYELEKVFVTMAFDFISVALLFMFM